jgi:release factor glutamine methyltransferase
LRLLTRLIQDAPAHLRAGGFLAFEFGLGQDGEIEKMLADASELTAVVFRRDLQGIARTAITQRR